MRNATKMTLIFCILIPTTALSVIRLYPGYVTKTSCQGKLLVSAVGNDQMARLEAIPKELGCGAILKPIALRGSTNLILETSTGTIREIVTIESGIPKVEQLSIILEPTIEREEERK